MRFNEWVHIGMCHFMNQQRFGEGIVNGQAIGRTHTEDLIKLLGTVGQRGTHAKVAVADGRMCFVTSANLTGYAMEKNMEAGVLVTGGGIPERLHAHLLSLISGKVIHQI